MPTVLHAADVVCPLPDPPLARGGVLVEAGRIVAVAPATDLEGQAERVVRHAGVLLPGLVDARTCVERADARRAMAGRWDAERWSRSAHRGVHELLRAGVTLACDVVVGGPGVPALARAGVAGDSLVLVAEVADREADEVLAAVARALDRPARGRRVGVAVDAERTGPRVLAGACALAEARGVPLHVEAGAIALATLEAAGALRPGVRLVHPAGIGSAWARTLAERDVVVVPTPRAGEAGPGLADLAGAGTPTALGSGEVAPEPLADAAAFAAHASDAGLETWPTPDGPKPLAEAALRLATCDAAGRLGHGGAGALLPGAPADLTVVDVDADPSRPYEALLACGPGRAVLTLLRGVARARRTSASEPWPAPGDHKYEEA